MPVTQGLVKRGAFQKHTTHVGDRRCVPGGQRLVKQGASRKHIAHVGNRTKCSNVTTVG